MSTVKTITFRELRLAKLDRKVRVLHCSQELEAYLSSMATYRGNVDQVPGNIRKALADCMALSTRLEKPPSIGHQIKKFIKR